MASIKDWVREYWYLGLVAVLAGAFFLWQQRQPAPAVEPLPSSASVSSVSAMAASASVAPKNGYVHIKGAVVTPGVYPVKATTRWIDIVELAGGLLAGADVSQVNLAQIAVDQESLYIPKVGETPPTGTPTLTGPSGAATGTSATSGAETLVNLNTATDAELQTLSGIGPKKSADIIAYREQNGDFKSIEDLKNVSGIGDKTFEALAPLVTVGP